jgi:uncharacterized protein YprB with RNaseH-like and TPR domain
MSDIQEQLATLRRRIAKIDAKYAGDKPRRPAPPAPTPEERLPFTPFDVIETEHGKHCETEKLYDRHKRHGSIGIGDLEDMSGDFLHPISGGKIQGIPSSKWCFLDTETTGLAGGSGTYAFLIGVGRISSDGFRVRQFFMRDFGDEASVLGALHQHLKQFEVLITYNGRTYDQPLLETRFRMVRQRPPFSSLEHLDLLFGARRLWNLRFDSCRLVHLENQILGLERQGDLPGELIPYVYFDYLRTQEMARLIPILHHNAMDIVTLACLTAIVPRAFHTEATFSHGAEMIGLARWWRQADQHENALALFRQALDRHLPDDLMFRTMWDIALLEKKLGREHAALPILTELAGCRNAWRAPAFVELAKYYEHRERNYSMALEMTRNAIAIAPTDALERRAVRLQKRTGSSAIIQRVFSPL